jgi:hypothetical protein
MIISESVEKVSDQGGGGGGPAGGRNSAFADCTAGWADSAHEGGVEKPQVGGHSGASTACCSAGGSSWAGEVGVDGDDAGAGGGEVTSDGDLSREVATRVIGEANDSWAFPEDWWQLTAETDAESGGETSEAGSGEGAVEKSWGMGDSISSSSKSVSRSRSASHLRLAAFQVHLASGEAMYAGEGG